MKIIEKGLLALDKNELSKKDMLQLTGAGNCTNQSCEIHCVCFSEEYKCYIDK